MSRERVGRQDMQPVRVRSARVPWWPGPASAPETDLPWPEEGAADVWLFDIDALSCAAPGAFAWLDDAEQRRAARYVSTSARASFLAGRHALRVLLARYLRAAPASLRFACNAYGKPRLVQDGWGGSLQFNLSHSGNGLLIGVARCELGVDLQAAVHERTLSGLQTCLSLEERAVVSMPGTPEASAARLLACWSRKEAISKAIGMGLQLDPRRLSVPTDVSCAGVPVAVEGHGRWWLTSLDMESDAHAAVASAVPLAEIRLRRVDARRAGWP